MLAHMPECDNPDYLDKFIVCLKISDDGTGGAHSELAETIEKAYKSEMERSVSPVSPEIGMIIIFLLYITMASQTSKGKPLLSHCSCANLTQQRTTEPLCVLVCLASRIKGGRLIERFSCCVILLVLGHEAQFILIVH